MLLLWRQIPPTTGMCVSSSVCLDVAALACVRSTDSSWEPRSTPRGTDPTFTYRLMGEQQRRGDGVCGWGKTGPTLGSSRPVWSLRASIWGSVSVQFEEKEALRMMWSWAKTPPAPGTLFYNWYNVDPGVGGVRGGWMFQGGRAYA